MGWMDLPWLEGLAVAFYEREGFDPETPVSTFRLARARWGPDAIIRPLTSMTAAAVTFIHEGRRRFAIRSKLHAPYALHKCGHELAHPILEDEGYLEEDLEEACDFLGAALMAPMPAVMRAWRTWGDDTRVELAAAARMTETSAAMRIGEVLRVPRIVVTPARVYVRGPVEWNVPPDAELRTWQRRTPPRVAKARLRDDPRRTLFIPMDAETA